MFDKFECDKKSSVPSNPCPEQSLFRAIPVPPVSGNEDSSPSLLAFHLIFQNLVIGVPTCIGSCVTTNFNQPA